MVKHELCSVVEGWNGSARFGTLTNCSCAPSVLFVTGLKLQTCLMLLFVTVWKLQTGGTVQRTLSRE